MTHLFPSSDTSVSTPLPDGTLQRAVKSPGVDPLSTCTGKEESTRRGGRNKRSTSNGNLTEVLDSVSTRWTEWDAFLTKV